MQVVRSTPLVAYLLIAIALGYVPAHARARKGPGLAVKSITFRDAASHRAIRGLDPLVGNGSASVGSLPSRTVLLHPNVTGRASSVCSVRLTFTNTATGKRTRFRDRGAACRRDGTRRRSGSGIRWSPRPGSYRVKGVVLARRARGVRASGRVYNATVSFTRSPSSPGSGAVPRGDGPPAAALAAWRDQMLTFGRNHCARLKSGGSFDQQLADTYYDAEWVYFQIADYTGDPSWYSCAQAAEAVYRDRYVVPNGGVIPGYWHFSHGLTRDYLQYGDAASRAAAIQLSQTASFASDATAPSATVSADMSRETAYAIMSYINTEHLGAPRRSRRELLIQHALGHLDQWFVSRNAPYVRPFMFALTAQALITYAEETGDVSRVLGPIARGARWIWENTWLPGERAFKYTDRNVASGGTEPAPDLNLLIAPVYAWLWHQTGEASFRDQADQIFAGGVERAYLVNAKQFNQNYRWSFAYVNWRSATPLR